MWKRAVSSFLQVKRCGGWLHILKEAHASFHGELDNGWELIGKLGENGFLKSTTIVYPSC